MINLERLVQWSKNIIAAGAIALSVNNCSPPPEIVAEQTTHSSQEDCPDSFCQEVSEDSCEIPIKIEDELGNTFKVPYCKSLINENDVKVSFHNLSGRLMIYSTREVEGDEQLLDYHIFNQTPISFKPIHIYSNGEVIKILSFDESHIVLSPDSNCDEPHCNLIEENITDFLFVEDDDIEYYYDNAVFTSEQIKEKYLSKSIPLNKSSLRFLRDRLGFFPPVDKLVEFVFYRPEEQGVANALGFGIRNYYQKKISEEKTGNLSYGNTHEFLHAFLYGTPVITGPDGAHWLEEGLADYLEHTHYGINNLHCRKNGWENGYHDKEDKFISTSPFVPYSDLTTLPKPTPEHYNPLNNSSFYRSAECFWAYIKENYGNQAIRDIAQVWNNTRKTLPPKERWLVKDIINPTLDVDLSPLVEERYNYVEE